MDLGEYLVLSIHQFYIGMQMARTLMRALHWFCSICPTYQQIKTAFVWEHSTHFHKSRQILAKKIKKKKLKKKKICLRVSFICIGSNSHWQHWKVIQKKSSSLSLKAPTVMQRSNSPTTEQINVIKCRERNRAILQIPALLLLWV